MSGIKDKLINYLDEKHGNRCEEGGTKPIYMENFELVNECEKRKII